MDAGGRYPRDCHTISHTDNGNHSHDTFHRWKCHYRRCLRFFHQYARPFFSGRGYTWNTGQVKPDLVAPGVDITSCAVGGRLRIPKRHLHGCSFFVSGSCALLMQWGILQNNDPFLYGEKMKAYLIRGARQLPFSVSYPNPQSGYGALCVSSSLDVCVICSTILR